MARESQSIVPPAPLLEEDNKPLPEGDSTAVDITVLDPSEMTDEMKDAVIRHFQANLSNYQDRYEYMEKNAQSAYQQSRELREVYDQLLKESAVKINLLKQNISTLYQNSLMIKLGE